MDLSIVLTVGKYAILVALYAFVLVVFRGIIAQLAAESRRGREMAAEAVGRPARAARPRPPARTAPPRAAPQLEPAPPAEPPAYEPPVVPEPISVAPEPQIEVRPEPVPAPLIPEQQRPPQLAAAKIDLLAELQAEDEPPARHEPEPEPVRAERAARLVVIESVDETHRIGETIPLSAAVTIGRSDENSLQVSDRFISSRHLLICLRDGRRILVDRGSTNGTFVNGQRIEEEVELAGGDRIALGNTVLEYHAG